MEIPEVGDYIELVKMGRDPDPIPDGSRGTVNHVQHLGRMFDDNIQVGVDWDPEVKRSLSLILPADEIKIVTKNICPS